MLARTGRQKCACKSVTLVPCSRGRGSTTETRVSLPVAAADTYSHMPHAMTVRRVNSCRVFCLAFSLALVASPHVTADVLTLFYYLEKVESPGLTPLNLANLS